MTGPKPSGTTGPADAPKETPIPYWEITDAKRLHKIIERRNAELAETMRIADGWRDELEALKAGPADAGSHDAIIEQAEIVASSWERGRYGDKTLRLRAELTASTLRELIERLLAASASARRADAGSHETLEDLVGAVLHGAWQLDNKPHQLFSALRKLALAYADPADRAETVRLLDACYNGNVLNGWQERLAASASAPAAPREIP